MRPVMTIAALAAVGGLLVPSLLCAQPGGGGGFRGGLDGGILGLLQQRDVQQEIELNDDQADELRTLGESLRREIREQMQDVFRGMRDLGDEERQARFAEVRDQMEAFRQDAEARIGEVLLPHQLERLKQIDLQARLQRGGAAALTGDELADQLGLSDAQREALRERAGKVEQELQQKIRQLRQEARDELLSVLTSEQRAKLESLMGQQFDLPEAGRGAAWQRGGRRGFGGRNRDRGSENPPNNAESNQN